MSNDPVVVAFESRSADYRRIMGELRILDARMVESGLSESERARWTELSRQVAAERNQLNAMLYASDVDSEQRAAMWWLMQPESTNREDD